MKRRRAPGCLAPALLALLPTSPVPLHSVAFLLLCLFLSCSTPGAGAASLYGSGTSSALPVWNAWTKAYVFVRDDIKISYESVGTANALDTYAAGNADFMSLDRPIPPDIALLYGDLAQFPIAGQAIVFAYNISTLNANDPDLILDRDIVGRIWAGNITQWDDESIQRLNPQLEGKLPSTNITLGYSDNTVISVPEVVKRALSSFSPFFASALQQSCGTFACMAPALRGTAFDAGISSPTRITWMKGRKDVMTFVNYYDAVAQGVKWAKMYNRAGQLVQASTDTVQSSMAAFLPQFGQSNFTIDIYDAPGPNSWPIAYMSYFSMGRNVTVFDCNNVRELLNFVAWIHTNDGTSTTLIDLNFVPLDVTLRKRLIDLLNTIMCNNKQAYSTTYLIGVGPSLPLYTAWAVSRSQSMDTRVKYFLSSASTESAQQLATYDTDFGATDSGLASRYFTLMPDLALVPITAYAAVPGYNLPSLRGHRLVLDFQTIAAIYMNEITMWNDQRIIDINTPEVSALLPNESIIVVTLSAPSETTKLFTSVLRATVPKFASEVGGGSLVVTFPVQKAGGNRSIVANSSENMMNQLIKTPKSFGFSRLYDVMLTQYLEAAALINPAGHKVEANRDSVLSAIDDYLASTFPHSNFSSLILGGGVGSWPMATFGSFFYRQATMEDCSKASALADFLYWTQTDPVAQDIADMQGFVLATSAEPINKLFLNYLKNFTCDGFQVSSIATCITDDGTLCSSAGRCSSGGCVCDEGRTGTYCEDFVSSTDSVPENVIIALSIAIPAGAIFCLLLTCIIILLAIAVLRRRQRDDWEIDFDELEMGDIIGIGGFGEVYRATWKGTEVAVKMLSASKASKDMERNFKDEVRLMTTLRHPNVVLFMAASTKASHMCIVMEFMSLGSLYDLLHNSLVDEIPFLLKAKIALQASKGMHFLHSSGIVHRDLKSLNLLLDTKWNVKVSDFGLTKFKEDLKKRDNRETVGSMHWAAPEILRDPANADYLLADVYSFGIILWELLTREQPYEDMSLAAVAVGVLRDNIRPSMPALGDEPPEYQLLITECWHADPLMRPQFLEIMTRLSKMIPDVFSSTINSYSSSSTSSASYQPIQPGSLGAAAIRFGSSFAQIQRVPHGHSDSEHNDSMNSSGSLDVAATWGAELGIQRQTSHTKGKVLEAAMISTKPDVRPPDASEDVTIVFSDIWRAASLWESEPAAMRDATVQHNAILRELLRPHRGYEVFFVRDRTSGEGSFCMAFAQPADALAWCIAVQRSLLQHTQWPHQLLALAAAAEEFSPDTGELIYRGLRVRIGLHTGSVRLVRDPVSRRVEYIGPTVHTAARITALASGGQILMTEATHQRILAEEKDTTLQPLYQIIAVGEDSLPDSTSGAQLYEVRMARLERRFCGIIRSVSDDENRRAMGQKCEDRPPEPEEDRLASANLCRWILDYHEIKMGEQLGMGSFGIVYRSKWKGIVVAVKRFVKQKLDEKHMLEFRAEIAFISELHHPNIITLIGACVKTPNLSIITEYVERGSLQSILRSTLRLSWERRLQFLRGAARGLHYLHSLHPAIVHRSFKSSNLLVDEHWNVKVADFGFTRIKEENATMTRCGAPCWSSPEVIRGDPCDELADVYAYGIVMWEVLTRREPYAGHNFMGVALEVLEGRRPPVPSDCPPAIAAMMKKCWHSKAAKRPTMTEVLAFLDSELLQSQSGGDNETGHMTILDHEEDSD